MVEGVGDQRRLRDRRQVACLRGGMPVYDGYALLALAREGGSEGEAKNDDQEHGRGEADRFYGRASQHGLR
jgi:hypothetical protein